MTRPMLVCGPKSVSPPHPTDWDLPVSQGGISVQSLNGTTLKDIPWRKYQYILTWEAMTDTDFNALEDVINYSNDFDVAIFFTYPLWRNTESGIWVTAEPMERSYAQYGCYENVVLTLTEQDPRAMIS